MNIFDCLYSTLYKSNLIESSAGTGKTNIISLLYLRILLNINIDKYFFNLLINNILIVTFTDLASLEIKNRILNNIRYLKQSCIRNKCINKNISNIFNYIKNIPNIINLLIQIENNIDYISIFTIHGFCKKIMFNYFIEFNIDISSKILPDEYNLIYELVINYWYNNLSFLNKNIILIILKYWYNYNYLFNDIIKIYNFNKFKCNFKKNEFYSIKDCYLNILNYINFFKKEWLLNSKYLYNYFLEFNNKIFNFKILNKLFKDINIWANSKTLNFDIPKDLYKLGYKYLLYNYKNIFLNKYYILLYIDYLLIIVNNLYNYVLLDCLKFIKINIKLKKKEESLISFDDLINKFNIFLNKNDNIFFINYIRKCYPIVLIDEFQDTDINQYYIFNKIYIKNNSDFKTKIILIGDPKQLIYSFRGANIFSYIYAKRKIKCIYTCNINWRASYFLNKSINYIFTRVKNFFLYKSINYIKLKSYIESKKLYILNNKNIDSSIKFYIFKNINRKNIKFNLAKYCAIKIIKLLNNKNKYILDQNNNKRNICPSDFCILVYSNSDIKIILDVFKNFNLPIFYSNNKDSIFNTCESQDIIYILKCILFPTSKINIRNMLLTNLFGYNILNINNYLNNNYYLNNIIEELYFYYDLWNKFGIYSMIKYIVKNKKKNSNFILNYNQYIINIFHLSEILQYIYKKLNNKFLLLKWLENKVIYKKNIFKKKYYIRSEYYNKQSINISTIHKSKGLQYNIVWLPFLIKFKLPNKFFYFYDRKNFIFNLDLYKTLKGKYLMMEEIFSEEIRLFYVAVTRSIYQCNIFIYDYNIVNKIFNNIYVNNIFGIYKINSFINLENYIKLNINYKYILIKFINIYKYINYKNIFFYKKKKNKLNLNIKNIYLKNNKNIFSYSSIKKKILCLKKNNIIKDIKNSIFLLRGKNIGNFFHNIIENINFNNFNYDINFLLYKLREFNINKKYFFLVKNILFNLLNVKINNLNINLCNKNILNIYKEFNFFLYIYKKSNLNNYFNIINKYDLISKECDNLNLSSDFYGFLNGVIDLIFNYKNKYYIIDFKTNWIDYHYTSYNNKNIFKLMCKNRYDIQYQIYSLALHKYLKMKYKYYNYNNNFGGIYYIFLRGLNLDINYKSFTGIYFIKPKYKLIYKLSKFFKNKKIFYEKYSK